jgi:hypothetical protein
MTRSAQQLAAIVAQFEAAQARLHRLLPTVPAERWSVRADPARWSVAECVAHLNLTGQVYLPLLRTAWAEARAVAGPAPERYRRDFAGWLLSYAVGPMPRVGRWAFGRARTIAAFVPSGDLPRDQVVAEFDRLQAEQVALTRAAAGLALGAVRITSPFNARLKYNGYACLVILHRHQQRHLWQAEQVWRDRP